MPKGANSIILVITIGRLKAPTAYINYQNFKTSKGVYSSERVKYESENSK